MRNIYLVVKQEIRAVLGKPSFWVMTFLFPAFFLLVNVGSQIMANRMVESSQDSLRAMQSSAPQPTGASLTGYVDQAGLIREIPADLAAGNLRAYPDEASAQAALRSGELASYTLIPPDYLHTGKLLVTQRQFSPFGSTSEVLFQYLIAYNLTQDEALTEALIQPLGKVEAHALAEQSGAQSGNTLARMVPYAVLFIFFFLLASSSGLMLQSVSREKENRTAEVLLLSLEPRHLMLGKVIGLCTVALLQITLWVGAGLAALNGGKVLFNAAAVYTLPPGFFIPAVLYFLLGYLMYASLMGAIGALAPSAREGAQFTFVILLPLMLPVFFNTAFLEAPDGILPVLLSLFPLSAPAAMVTRLVAGSVPLWQLAASLCGVAVTTYFITVLSARFFRADTLLSGAVLKWDRLLLELRQAIARS
jgi:ABC-2 type transport system permease protein